MRQYILFQSILLLQIVIWKTDELQFESRDNLGWLKFLYYLMVNDRSKHKLNNRNFKIIKLFIRLLHFIFIRIFDRFSLLFTFCFCCLNFFLFDYHYYLVSTIYIHVCILCIYKFTRWITIIYLYFDDLLLDEIETNQYTFQQIIVTKNYPNDL